MPVTFYLEHGFEKEEGRGDQTHNLPCSANAFSRCGLQNGSIPGSCELSESKCSGTTSDLPSQKLPVEAQDPVGPQFPMEF